MTFAPPPSGIFLAGTDTSVGKTTVAAALLRLARRRSLALLPFKPAETGLDGHHPADSERLRAAAGRPELSLDDICPFPFSSPVAPAAAAAAVGTRIDLPALRAALARIRALGDSVLVESVGGLLSPYAPKLTTADVAAAFEYPVLLVARNGLGTINHTALSLAELQRRQLPLAGVVLVDTLEQATPDQSTNARLIADLTGVAPLGTLPYVPSLDPDRLADALAAAIDVESIFAVLAALPAVCAS